METPRPTPETVQGTLVIGDLGEAWVDSGLTEEEQAQARAWLAKRHLLGPGFNATVTWLRADRVVGTICPRRSCRRIAHKVRTDVVATEGRPGHGHLVCYYGCRRCGRTYRIVRDADRDHLEVLS